MAEQPQAQSQQPEAKGTWVHFTESVRLFGEKEGHIFARAGERIKIYSQKLLDEILENEWGRRVEGAAKEVLDDVEAEFQRIMSDLLKRRNELQEKIATEEDAMDQEALAVLNDQIAKLEAKRRQQQKDAKQ